MSIAACKPRRSSLGKTAAAVLSCLFVISPVVLAAGIRIMPLGDSITMGVGSTDGSGYRKRLYNRLVGVDYDVDFVGSQKDGPTTFDRDHEGHGGFTAPEIAAQAFGWVSANPADIVLLHAGTNDVEKKPADIGMVLDEIHRFSTDTWVVLALIINRDWGDHYDTIVFNKALRSYAENRIARGDKIVIVDQEHALDYPDDLADDSLHPNDTGYRKMADVWLQGLLEILPAANAGPDQDVNPGDVVNLDGTGSSDRIGAIVSYRWSQTAGTPVVLANADTAMASFTAPDTSGGGTLTFRLAIEDAKGLTHSDDCDVGINGPPVADAGGDQQVSSGQDVTLDGTGSRDPDGDVLSYQWMQTGGSPAVVLMDAAAARAQFVAPAVGSAGALLTFQLTVNDGRGGQDSDTIVVGVNRAPAPDNGSSGSGGGGGGCFIGTLGS